jgi:hypothetical protein
LLFSCSNSKVAKGELEGTVIDATGLDGCGLLIKLDNGSTLQPVVLPTGFTLQKDKRVKLTYTILKDRMSTCMNGSIAEITSISYL